MHWDALAFLEPNLLDADLLPAEDVPAEIQTHLTAVATNKELQRFIGAAGSRYRSLWRAIPRLKTRGKPTREEIKSLKKEIPGLARIPLPKLMKYFGEAKLPVRPNRRSQGVALAVRERHGVQQALARLLSIKLRFVEICHRNLVPTMLWPVIWRQMVAEPGKKLEELVPRALKDNKHVSGRSMGGYMGVGWNGKPSLFAVLLLDIEKADDKKIKKMVDELRRRAQASHKTGTRDTKSKRVVSAAIAVLEALKSGKPHAGMAETRREEYAAAWNAFARDGESGATVKYSVAVMYCWLHEKREDVEGVYEFLSPRTIQRELRAMWERSTKRRTIKGFADLLPSAGELSGEDEVEPLAF